MVTDAADGPTGGAIAASIQILSLLIMSSQVRHQMFVHFCPLLLSVEPAEFICLPVDPLPNNGCQLHSIHWPESITATFHHRGYHYLLSLALYLSHLPGNRPGAPPTYPASLALLTCQ